MRDLLKKYLKERHAYVKKLINGEVKIDPDELSKLQRQMQYRMAFDYRSCGCSHV